MLKINPQIMGELLYKAWALIGRTKIYPKEWVRSLLTPIHKKFSTIEPKNYQPLCMRSCLRKVFEAAIAEKVAKELNVYVRKFGFQRHFSPKITLLDENSAVRNGKNRLATLDLSKAYDKVYRSILIHDCRQ